MLFVVLSLCSTVCVKVVSHNDVRVHDGFIFRAILRHLTANKHIRRVNLKATLSQVFAFLYLVVIISPMSSEPPVYLHSILLGYRLVACCDDAVLGTTGKEPTYGHGDRGGKKTFNAGPTASSPATVNAAIRLFFCPALSKMT